MPKKSEKKVVVEEVEESEEIEIPELDDKTKKAVIRFMKTYGAESVRIQGFDFTLESLGSSPKGSKKVKKEKDPNAPKLATTSYMRFQSHFSEAEREKMKAKAMKKGIKYQALVSEMWKALGEDGQKPYKDAYDEDKKLYDIAKEKYLASKQKAEKVEEVKEEEAEEEEAEEEVEIESKMEEIDESDDESAEEEEVEVKPAKDSKEVKKPKPKPKNKGKGKSKK